ncbi:DUF2892 domain-containing protein [Leptospira langatensis]|uniref:DUF2892 domain-containing protein n=1 Tax=Leptospira langatensis TaxID=2484983 RepID=A0A5F1ZU12_9LEPT|nr:YgaP-like transmembrane domain [Leptospira langatensis]TGK03178.1 DUF2892 domain-containing protein [Leptospira langatensis]TGL41934.1 DUF2892 domain-containing protein [Leptospira langatensis]
MTQKKATTWYLERVLFAIAGTFSLIGLYVGYFLTPWGLALNLLVSLNLLLFATVRFCPAAYILSKLGVPYKCEGKEASV